MRLLPFLPLVGAFLIQSAWGAVLQKRANDVTLTVDPSKTMVNNYKIGAMLEANLNDLTDGGLVAELLVNHAFQEQSGSIAHWTAVGGASLTLQKTGGVSNAIPAHVQVAPGPANIGIENPGWAGGIGVKQNVKYDTFFYAKADQDGTVPISVGVYSGDTELGAAATVQAALTTSWQRFSASFTPSSGSDGDSTWRLTFPSGTSTNVYLAYASLTPPFYEGQPLRQDIAQLYRDLKPAYLRLPGGNDLEGNSQESRYRWNLTVGDILDRPGRPGTWTGWNTETMGVHELLDFCELIGTAPILGLYAGYSLDRSVSPDINAIAAEVIDQLHYITDTSGTWADLRAANGRSQPWTLNLLEIGNEDFLGDGPRTYQSRWDTITAAIKKEFGDTRFELISTFTEINGWQATDLHDYGKPAQFMGWYSRFDDYSRTDGKRYYELEYAVVNSGLGAPDEDALSGPNRLEYPTLDAALAEAIFMEGMERNGDIIYGSAYAPGGGSTVVNQWTPNLIIWNAGSAAKTTSYLTQQGFSLYPTMTTMTGVAASAPPTSSNVYHSIGKNEAGQYVVRLVNYNNGISTATVGVTGAKLTAQGATRWQLNGDGGVSDLQAANTVEAEPVTASTSPLAAEDVNSNGQLVLALPPYSFTVVTVPTA